MKRFVAAFTIAIVGDLGIAQATSGPWEALGLAVGLAFGVTSVCLGVRAIILSPSNAPNAIVDSHRNGQDRETGLGS